MPQIFYEDKGCGDVQTETYEDAVSADRSFWNLVSVAVEGYTGLPMTIVSQLDCIRAKMVDQGRDLVTVEVSF